MLVEYNTREEKNRIMRKGMRREEEEKRWGMKEERIKKSK